MLIGFWLVLEHPGFAQWSYDSDTEDYTAIGEQTMNTQNYGGGVNLKDVWVINFGNYGWLKTKEEVKAEIDAVLHNTDSYVEVRVYLLGDDTSVKDANKQLIWGARKEYGTPTLLPVDMVPLNGGVKNDVPVEVSSLEMDRILNHVSNPFNRVSSQVKDKIDQAGKDISVKQTTAWTWSKRLGGAGVLTFGAGVGWLCNLEAITLASVSGPVAVMGLGALLGYYSIWQFMEATSPVDIKNEVLIKEEVSEFEFGHAVIHEEKHHLAESYMYIEVKAKDATVKSFTLPRLDIVKMSLFKTVENKKIFLQGLDDSSQLQDNSIMVSAHRGYWRTAPPNSLASLEAAIKRGSHMAEMDLNQTLDGKVVALHDKSVNRTTNWEQISAENAEKIKKIAALTFAEARQLKLVDRFNQVYLNDPQDPQSFERIPNLEEIFKKSRGRILMNLDKFEQFIPEVYQAALQAGALGDIIGKGYKSPAEMIAAIEAYNSDEPGMEDKKELYDLMPGDTGEEKLRNLMNKVDYTPIVNDWVVVDGHANSIQEFIDAWKGYDVRGFETDPETYNSPVFEYIKTLNSEGYRTGSYVPFADSGEGHALQKGRVKFDFPFGVRGNWDDMVDGGINFMVNDRSAGMEQFLQAIGQRNNGTKPIAAKKSQLGIGDGEVMVVAHRSAWQYAPENSMASFQLAVDMGVDMLEMDARVTKDNQAVVYHDWTLNQNTNFIQHFGAVKAYDANNTRRKDQQGNSLWVLTRNTDALSTIWSMGNSYAKKMWVPDEFGENEEKDDLSSAYGLLVTDAIRHWNQADLTQLLLLDKDGNVSNQHISTLEEVLEFCKDRILVSLDKWNSCPPQEDASYCQNAPKNNLTIFLQAAETVGALDVLILGDLRKPKTAITGTDFTVADYYDPQTVESLFTINATNYLTKVGAYMPRVNVSMIGHGMSPETYVNDFLSESWAKSFLIKIPEVGVDGITQDEQDRIRKLIYTIRQAGKRVYLAPTQSSQVGGTGYTDESALIDPDAAWGWLIDKSGLQPDGTTEAAGANMLESNYLYEILRYLRSKSLHN